MSTEPLDRLQTPTLTRRQVLTSTAGSVGVLALVRGRPVAAWMQEAATPVATAGGGVPVNLAALGPIPEIDLPGYGLANQTIYYPPANPFFGNILANKISPQAGAALARLSIDIAYLESLANPIVEDYSQITDEVAALTLVAPAETAPNWDALFAAIPGTKPVAEPVGDRAVTWSTSGQPFSFSGAVNTRGLALLFSRDRYAHLINVTNAAGVAPSAADIVALAKLVDERVSLALAGRWTPALRPVIPLLDLADLYSNPAQLDLADLYSNQVQISLRAVDGTLLRTLLENDQAIAQVQAALQLVLDQGATIVTAGLGSTSTDRGRDPIVQAFLPEFANRINYRDLRAGVSFELYSLPPDSDPAVIQNYLEQRLQSNLDYDITPLEPGNAARMLTSPRTQFARQEATGRPRIVNRYTKKNAANSSGGPFAAYDLIADFLGEKAGPTGQDTFNQKLLLQLAITPGTSGDPLPNDYLAGPKAADLRAATDEFALRILAGRSYHVAFPAPPTPIPATPVAGSLSSVPVVGFAGIVPHPGGARKSYVYDFNQSPSLVLPLELNGFTPWGEHAKSLLPSPVANAVYNLPLALAYQASIQTDDIRRRITSYVLVDPTADTPSWEAIAGAIDKPRKCPEPLGDRCHGWTGGATDPNSPFRDYEGAAIFFARGPFGVIVEIRDYTLKKPSLRQVSALAKPIDDLLAGAVSGSPLPPEARYGLPIFGHPNGAVQQMRIVDGVLIGASSDAVPPDGAAAAVLRAALDAKATMTLSLEDMPQDVLAALFTGGTGDVPVSLFGRYEGELYGFDRASNADVFAAGLMDRLALKYVDSEFMPLGEDGNLVIVEQTSGTYVTSYVVAQRTEDERVGVAIVQISTHDPSLVTASALSHNTPVLEGTAAMAAQIAAGTAYRFEVPETQ